uniref:Uncharacterized protein n=1 Tax=Cairina moschata TaxID=8855 RepID=A0A8C3BRS7_CAIMO
SPSRTAFKHVPACKRAFNCHPGEYGSSSGFLPGFLESPEVPRVHAQTLGAKSVQSSGTWQQNTSSINPSSFSFLVTPGDLHALCQEPQQGLLQRQGEVWAAIAPVPAAQASWLSRQGPKQGSSPTGVGPWGMSRAKQIPVLLGQR